MPTTYLSEEDKTKRAKVIRAKLLARGLNPRGQGFSRAFFAAMKRK